MEIGSKTRSKSGWNKSGEQIKWKFGWKNSVEKQVNKLGEQIVWKNFLFNFFGKIGQNNWLKKFSGNILLKIQLGKLCGYCL